MKGKKMNDAKGRRSKSSSPELKAMTPDFSLHFSSSAFQNSPDPTLLPVPIFDDEDSVVEYPVPIAFHATKTEKLRQFLNLRPQAVTI
jgi:hypothetical protein